MFEFFRKFQNFGVKKFCYIVKYLFKLIFRLFLVASSITPCSITLE